MAMGSSGRSVRTVLELERACPSPRPGRESGWTLFCREIETLLGDSFENVRRSVLGYARRIAGDTLAEDIVQEAFLRILTYCRGRERAMTWAFIFAVTRNVARTVLAEKKRARNGLGEFQQDRAGSSAADMPLDDLLPERITEELSALPERQRDALMLTEVHGLSEVQAALIMRMSRAAVGARRRAALRRLRHVA